MMKVLITVTIMLGKRVIKFESLRLGQILSADKIGFCRLGHIYRYM